MYYMSTLSETMGKIKIKLKNKETVNFQVDTIKYVYYNVKKEINNMNSVFDQL